MATARNVLGKLKSSDGRIRVKTLSGVSALVAVIALLVGVLPAIANHGPAETDSKVDPVRVEYGGGSGACAFVESAAEFEAHDNNPMTKTITGPDGTQISIVVSGNVFSFDVLTAGMAVYDVVVNGGPHNNHYDYDGILGHPVTDDQGLHAPMKNAKQTHNLSHINICYDEMTTVTFVCGADPLLLSGDGVITDVAATIFDNSDHDCPDSKEAFYTLVDDVITLGFIGDTGLEVAGRLDVTKDFGDPSLFENLEYDGGPATGFEDVPWCIIAPKDLGDGPEFDVPLDSTTEYPNLPAGHTACKVYEGENSAGIQFNVNYFEFVDPQFR